MRCQFEHNGALLLADNSLHDGQDSCSSVTQRNTRILWDWYSLPLLDTDTRAYLGNIPSPEGGNRVLLPIRSVEGYYRRTLRTIMLLEHDHNRSPRQIQQRVTHENTPLDTDQGIHRLHSAPEVQHSVEDLRYDLLRKFLRITSDTYKLVNKALMMY